MKPVSLGGRYQTIWTEEDGTNYMLAGLSSRHLTTILTKLHYLSLQHENFQYPPCTANLFKEAEKRKLGNLKCTQNKKKNSSQSSSTEPSERDSLTTTRTYSRPLRMEARNLFVRAVWQDSSSS